MASDKIVEPSVAEETALFAMLASNAYGERDGRVVFPVEKLGWVRVDEKGRPTAYPSYSPTTIFGRAFSNLQFDIWDNPNLQTTVFAFKGTDEKIDWFTGNLTVGISVPYKSAKKRVERYRERFPDRQVLLTGHSLGGGIALSVSVWQGLPAVVFNPSPRIFDGWRENSKPASRRVVYQEGDALQIVRTKHPKFLMTISEDQILSTKFNYDGRNTHRADLLAEGLLNCLSESSPLVAIRAAVTLSVGCSK